MSDVCRQPEESRFVPEQLINVVDVQSESCQTLLLHPPSEETFVFFIKASLSLRLI